ncbi:GerMN domain-containing protein [Heliophilum fasciatum]|uniref:Sporulation and spore germination protein n=1 Tax=Heliophilum fasciatum TaxID=35700 RepID=A0A4R2RSM3_9FIRM|nr:GerMN domain-containing protein [Heliophilum fasciatum]MCW2277436.1 spore germination protein GerM [Heliophilum fasciatum]TCP67272.1 sporulation and spore germination protein [Heliophilum fasciatum]
MDRERSWSAGIILLVTALVIAFGLGGCQAIDRFVAMKEDFKAKETSMIKVPALTTSGEGTGQAGAGEATAPSAAEPTGTQDRGVTAQPAQEVTLTLYFADPKGQNLVQEKRTVAKSESPARMAMQELIKGPSAGTQKLPTIPTGTRLLDIGVKDGLCTVNLSGEVQKNHQGGSTNESLTVYSIVNTLTQFPTITKVQLLVEGKKVESLAGHMDVSQAMARRSMTGTSEQKLR